MTGGGGNGTSVKALFHGDSGVTGKFEAGAWWRPFLNKTIEPFEHWPILHEMGVILKCSRRSVLELGPA